MFSPVADPSAAWERHQRALEGLTDWTAVGKIAVRTSDDGWSASVRWEQWGENYRIRLSGPLGQGALEVSGRPGFVELRTADRRRFTAARPETLLAKHTGLRVPVPVLRYWLIGRPAPEPAPSPVQLELDPGGRLARLVQSGWELDVSRYAGPEGLALPARLDILREDVSARIVVTEWHTGVSLP